MTEPFRRTPTPKIERVSRLDKRKSQGHLRDIKRNRHSIQSGIPPKEIRSEKKKKRSSSPKLSTAQQFMSGYLQHRPVRRNPRPSIKLIGRGSMTPATKGIQKYGRQRQRNLSRCSYSEIKHHKGEEGGQNQKTKKDQRSDFECEVIDRGGVGAEGGIMETAV